jgi:hypothetical protein
MKSGVLGVLLGAAVVWTISGRFPAIPTASARGAEQHRATPGGLIVTTSDAGEQLDQVTVVDPAARVMSVYHVDKRSGEITLRSVRNISWDLEMLEFNCTSPTPREIRSHAQQRR